MPPLASCRDRSNSTVSFGVVSIDAGSAKEAVSNLTDTTGRSGPLQNVGWMGGTRNVNAEGDVHAPSWVWDLSCPLNAAAMANDLPARQALMNAADSNTCTSSAQEDTRRLGSVAGGLAWMAEGKTVGRGPGATVCEDRVRK